MTFYRLLSIDQFVHGEFLIDSQDIPGAKSFHGDAAGALEWVLQRYKMPFNSDMLLEEFVRYVS